MNKTKGCLIANFATVPHPLPFLRRAKRHAADHSCAAVSHAGRVDEYAGYRPIPEGAPVLHDPAYLPKATVQAAIGAIPLAMGLGSGETILAVAVLAIILTAPLASGIELSYKRLLQKQQS
ncbi:hypothetical protein ACLE5O_28140 [Klebsiella pneumoniae]|uniref:hypothetical protein n=1 Tax=Klebsiella pneumoniae TaxID=573 RepID=UPI003AB0015B